MAAIPFSTQCPGTVCTCGGTQTVTAKRGTDRRTGRATISFTPCSALAAQGWTARYSEVRWA